MTETIWVMDSDCCDMCNGLLDYFGQCPHCGWDNCFGWDWDDSGEEDWYPGWGSDWDLPEEERGKP